MSGRAALAILGALVLPACFADREFCSEGTEPGPDGECLQSGAVTAIPILPATPDSARVDDCRACAEELCKPEWEECVDSPQCLALLRCQSDCSDPNCIFRCRDTHWESQIFDDYVECVFGGSILATGVSDERRGRCMDLDLCGTGQNWGCKGIFRWDLPPQQRTITVDVRVYDLAIPNLFGAPGPLAGLPGLEIASCGPGLGETRGDAGCEAFRQADGYGTLRALEFDPKRHDSIGVKGPYGDNRVYVRPLVRDARVEFGLVLRNNQFIGFQQAADFPLDRRLGMMQFEQYDCLAMPSEAFFDGIGTDGERYCWTDGVPNFDEVVSRSCGFVNVEPTQQVEVASFTNVGGEPQSRQTMRVDAGWSTYGELYPLSLPSR